MALMTNPHSHWVQVFKKMDICPFVLGGLQLLLFFLEHPVQRLHTNPIFSRNTANIAKY
jgi:hypothetical protein